MAPGVYTSYSAISTTGLDVLPVYLCWGKATEWQAGIPRQPSTATENPRPSEQLKVCWGPEFWLLEPWKYQILKGSEGPLENTKSHPYH